MVLGLCTKRAVVRKGMSIAGLSVSEYGSCAFCFRSLFLFPYFTATIFMYITAPCLCGESNEMERRKVGWAEMGPPGCQGEGEKRQKDEIWTCSPVVVVVAAMVTSVTNTGMKYNAGTNIMSMNTDNIHDDGEDDVRSIRRRRRRYALPSFILSSFH